MTFEETKKYLITNMNRTESIYSDFPRMATTIRKGIELIERLINDREVPEELGMETKEDFRNLLLSSCEVCLYNPISPEEREFLLCVHEILYNIDQKYCILPRFDLKVLKTLVVVRRTISDELLVLSLVLQRISQEVTAKSQSSLLSKKYLSEYKEFLNSRDYDSPYSSVEGKE